MYHQFTLRILLGIFLSFLLVGCSEKDTVYGESPDDYTMTNTASDAAARQYFRHKEIACVTDKAGIAKEYPPTTGSVYS